MDVFLPPSPRTRSYRTYEEWKLANEIPVILTIYGSYRTYEEWKLPTEEQLDELFDIGSYRTYEEWKPIFSDVLF